jgi:pimeloyl-ACP methyl ester carboxylesterase
MAHVDVGQQRLHVERRGTGAPVVLAMGVGATTAHWGTPFLDGLAAEFDVIAYDQRGAGRSERATGPFTVADLADDLGGLIDALDVAPAHVVGFSLGGMVAQELALRRSDVVRRLVLVGTAAGGAHGTTLNEATLRRLEEAMTSTNADVALRAGLQANVSPASAADIRTLARWTELVSAHPISLRTVQWQLQAAAAHDAAGRLPLVKSPTLIVHGEQDALVSPRHAQLLSDALGDAPVVIVPDTGHLVTWERPDAALAAIGPWLRGDVTHAPSSSSHRSDAQDVE